MLTDVEKKNAFPAHPGLRLCSQTRKQSPFFIRLRGNGTDFITGPADHIPQRPLIDLLFRQDHGLSLAVRGGHLSDRKRAAHRVVHMPHCIPSIFNVIFRICVSF